VEEDASLSIYLPSVHQSYNLFTVDKKGIYNILSQESFPNRM